MLAINFLSNSNFTDDQFIQLATSSPAVGAGQDGSGMGALDGPIPYKFSGLPPVPIVSDILIQSVTTNNTIEVEVKIIAQE